VVNNGAWDKTPSGNESRVKDFNLVIDAFKAAGMTVNMGPGGGPVPPTPKPTVFLN